MSSLLLPLHRGWFSMALESAAPAVLPSTSFKVRALAGFRDEAFAAADRNAGLSAGEPPSPPRDKEPRKSATEASLRNWKWGAMAGAGLVMASLNASWEFADVLLLPAAWFYGNAAMMLPGSVDVAWKWAAGRIDERHAALVVLMGIPLSLAFAAAGTFLWGRCGV